MSYGFQGHRLLLTPTGGKGCALQHKRQSVPKTIRVIDILKIACQNEHTPRLVF